MTHHARFRLPASTLNMAVILGLAVATMTGAFIPLAHADGGDHRNWHRQEDRGHRQEHRRGPRHHREYYRQPNMYYSAPPVIYQPRGYYQQPGASLNFIIPFSR